MFGKLMKVAEAFEIGLLERQALGEIGDFHVDMIPDDMRVGVVFTVVKPLKHIKVNFVKGSDATNHSRQ